MQLQPNSSSDISPSSFKILVPLPLVLPDLSDRSSRSRTAYTANLDDQSARHDLDRGLIHTADMDKILADNVPLNAALLATDEEQYDKEATSLVTHLQKLSVQQLASKEILQVMSPLQKVEPTNHGCRL